MKDKKEEILQDMRQTLDAMCDVLMILCERDRERDKMMTDFYANSFRGTSNHKHRQERLKKIREGKDD